MTKIEEYLEKNKEEFKPWLEENKQGRVELKILPYLKHIENGFFVEAGALDGLFMSNTKVLEDLGWNGLLIEPSNLAARKCKENRKVTVENCALVSNDYEGKVVYGDFFFDGTDGMGAWSGIHRSHYGIKAAKEAHAVTLNRILAHHKITKVDFLSLDVEGYELEAFKGVDLSTVDIPLILVEVNTNDYTLEAMDEYLSLYGYKNVANLSGFTTDMEGWDGSHNDYLYARS